MEPFKEIYNKNNVTKIAKEIAIVSPSFCQKIFLKTVIPKLKPLEMKDRVRMLSTTIYQQLDLPYPQLIEILLQTLANEKTHMHREWDEKPDEGLAGFLVWPLTNIVAEYGLDFFDESMSALKEMTKRFTAEFAIRPFIINYEKKVFETLMSWKADSNHHVRRLVSEGTRPNLPWGMKVSLINQNLKRNLNLIEGLEKDKELYVRRSVANHLNDISRLNKTLMLSTCKKWKNKLPETDWVIRHATRSLLKIGDPKALHLHGYSTTLKLSGSLKISPKKINEGESLTIKISVNAQNIKGKKLLLDLVVGFLKNNGTYSKKYFRLRDTSISHAESIIFEKIFPLKKVTTRKHYSGKQMLSLQANGKILDSCTFTLTV